MSASKKLSTAVKALNYLSLKDPKALQSAEIAEAIGCNASKLRQLLSMLVKAEILISTQGSLGGFTIKKAIEEINLQEIYCAIEDRKAFHLGVNYDDIENKMKNINHYFKDLYDEIQIDIEKKMRTISLRSIINNRNNEV
jgi:Rrf2 family protein